MALDTSALQLMFAGEAESEALKARLALENRQIVLPPAALSEALSDPELTVEKAERIRALPLLEIIDGYWARAGMLRGAVRAMRYNTSRGLPHRAIVHRSRHSHHHL